LWCARYTRRLVPVTSAGNRERYESPPFLEAGEIAVNAQALYRRHSDWRSRGSSGGNARLAGTG
jgi:hypothetical protein